VEHVTTLALLGLTDGATLCCDEQAASAALAATNAGTADDQIRDRPIENFLLMASGAFKYGIPEERQTVPDRAMVISLGELTSHCGFRSL
jgi:hypothetical protein